MYGSTTLEHTCGVDIYMSSTSQTVNSMTSSRIGDTALQSRTVTIRDSIDPSNTRWCRCSNFVTLTTRLDSPTSHVIALSIFDASARYTDIA